MTAKSEVKAKRTAVTTVIYIKIDSIPRLVRYILPVLPKLKPKPVPRCCSKIDSIMIKAELS